MLQVLHNHTESVNAVTFSPDGKMLASASDDKTVKVWDAASGALLHTLVGHTDLVRECYFLLDSKSLVSFTINRLLRDREARVWNSVTGELLLVLGDITTGLSLRKVDESLCPQSYSWHHQFCRNAFFSTRSGGWVLYVSVLEKRTTLFRPDSKEEISKLDNALWTYVEAMIWSLDGEIQAFASNKEIRLHDKLGAEIGRLKGHWDRVEGTTFSQDNELLALNSGGTFHLWEISTGNLIWTFNRYSGVDVISTTSLDGTLKAEVSNSKIIRLSSGVPGEAVRSLEGHSDQVMAIEISPDSKLLASASRDGTVRLWDTRIKPGLPSLDAHWDYVTTMTFSPDGKFLASAANDCTVKLWDVEERALCRNFAVPSGHVSLMTLSPDNKLLSLALSDSTVSLRRIVGGAVVETLKGHLECVTKMAFSPDSKILATAADREVPKLWDVAMGKELQLDKSNAVRFSPDGKTFSMRKGAFDTPMSRPPAISPEGHWLLRHEERILWLPPDHRPSVGATHGNKVGLGYKSGRVTIIDLAP